MNIQEMEDNPLNLYYNYKNRAVKFLSLELFLLIYIRNKIKFRFFGVKYYFLVMENLLKMDYLLKKDKG